MQADFKRCPRCDTPADTQAVECRKCGHAYRTVVTPPDLNKTQFISRNAPLTDMHTEASVFSGKRSTVFALAALVVVVLTSVLATLLILRSTSPQLFAGSASSATSPSPAAVAVPPESNPLSHPPDLNNNTLPPSSGMRREQADPSAATTTQSENDGCADLARSWRHVHTGFHENVALKEWGRPQRVEDHGEGNGQTWHYECDQYHLDIVFDGEGKAVDIAANYPTD